MPYESTGFDTATLYFLGSTHGFAYVLWISYTIESLSLWFYGEIAYSFQISLKSTFLLIWICRTFTSVYIDCLSMLQSAKNDNLIMPGDNCISFALRGFKYVYRETRSNCSFQNEHLWFPCSSLYLNILLCHNSNQQRCLNTPVITKSTVFNWNNH